MRNTTEQREILYSAKSTSGPVSGSEPPRPPTCKPLQAAIVPPDLVLPENSHSERGSSSYSLSEYSCQSGLWHNSVSRRSRDDGETETETETVGSGSGSVGSHVYEEGKNKIHHMEKQSYIQGQSRGLHELARQQRLSSSPTVIELMRGNYNTTPENAGVRCLFRGEAGAGASIRSAAMKTEDRNSNSMTTAHAKEDLSNALQFELTFDDADT
mmetsp:Transcript_19577/g.34905  ORF Transcript_19577/g.34905 Transcript_19577/m.34905 type:complete len:213 (-) Transcript_19577:457-1095(-)